jgi:rhamnogalacturonyl hydrolase YesR
MKKYITLFLILPFYCFLNGQTSTTVEDEVILRKIADNILKNVVFQFEGVYNGQTYATAKEIIPDTVSVKFKSNYAAWHYVNGVLNMAMLQLGKLLSDEKYTNHALNHIAYSFDNLKFFEKQYDPKNPKSRRIPYKQIIDTRELDDCGAMGASVIEVYQKVNRDDYRKYIEKAAKHISEVQDRLPDRTLVRKGPVQMTLWADDLYMSVPFLARAGKFFGEKKYYDDAIRQILNFDKYLWNSDKGLYYHCWYSDSKQNGVAHWGRCNGWIMMAQVHLLNILPNDYPKRDSVIRNLAKQIIGISRYQNGKGLWHQLLDKNDSYEESSCTAMFVYSIAKAVNEGWIDKRYASIALSGWEGLKKEMITEDGQMKNVCVGTGIRNDLVFYYARPAVTDDTHGTGALIEAGIEVIKLKKNMNM